MTMIADKFKDRLKEAMAGASNASFAEKCGLSEGTFRRYLRGDTFPPLDTLEKIAEVSGYSLAWLASGEGEIRRGEGVAAQPAVESGPVLDFALLEKIIIDLVIHQQLTTMPDALDAEGNVDEVHYLVAEMLGRQTASTVINTYKTCIGRPSTPADEIIKKFNSMVSVLTNKLNKIADKREVSAAQVEQAAPVYDEEAERLRNMSPAGKARVRAATIAQIKEIEDASAKDSSDLRPTGT
jgi:transcriptional regulator with XRE-family HTH domain